MLVEEVRHDLKSDFEGYFVGADRQSFLDLMAATAKARMQKAARATGR
jgi:hypothetical protein